MPTYSYTCTGCGGVFDIVKRMSDPPPDACRLCGSSEVSRVYTTPNVPSVRKTGPQSPAVADKLQPTGYMNNIPFYGAQSGLHALTLTHGPEGPRYVAHPNLAGPPPGWDSRDGRIAIVKNEDSAADK